jgi:hypothetical protein
MLQREVLASQPIRNDTFQLEINMSHYKAFDHQHLGEINQSVNQLQADYTNELIFVPKRDFAQNFCHFIYDNRGKPRRHIINTKLKISLL